MTKDARLYDIVSALSTNQPLKANELAKTILDEHIADSVRGLVSNTRINENTIREISQDDLKENLEGPKYIHYPHLMNIFSNRYSSDADPALIPDIFPAGGIHPIPTEDDHTTANIQATHAYNQEFKNNIRFDTHHKINFRYNPKGAEMLIPISTLLTR